MRSAHLALKGRPTVGDKGLKTPSSADNRLIDTTQTAREESEIFIRKPEVRDQPRRKTLTSRRRVAGRGRAGWGTRAVTSRTVLAGLVSSAAPPTLTPPQGAPATARPRRAARAGWGIRVRCHGQPARLVSVKPCSIQARRPYQQAVLAAGGSAVRSTHGSCSPGSPP